VLAEEGLTFHAWPPKLAPPAKEDLTSHLCDEGHRVSAESLNDVKGFLAVTDNLGTAGQPTAEQLARVGAEGYEVVINIDSATAVPNEDELVTSMGMSFIHIPVDWHAPEQENLDLFFSVMKAVEHRRVFLHCAANMRVSAFVYLYRIIHLGFDPEEAKRTMSLLWEPRGVWKEFVADALDRYGVTV
jgi:protein tyrosine phosphatase (PTP) superfamily phosphohydrolase (DUF442 family)